MTRTATAKLASDTSREVIRTPPPQSNPQSAWFDGTEAPGSVDRKTV